MTFKTFQRIALSFPETVEAPHFEKTSFRVKKKIFSTYSDKDHQATLKLSPQDQDLFALHNPDAVYPVPNKWGQQGWTIVELDKAHSEIISDALLAAYRQVAPPKLARAVKNNQENQDFH